MQEDFLDSPYKIGDIIDKRYEVVSFLGAGGTSVVYRVKDKLLEDDKVALKLQRVEFAERSDFRQRMQNEVRLARRLGHPNIVRVYDFGIEQNSICFVTMEYVSSATLASYLESQLLTRIGCIGASKLLLQLAESLQYAHSLGVIHRDVKPENVFMVTNEHVRLGDFGTAIEINASKRFTRAGEVFGTPNYMSPEQLLGKAVDRRTDIYSLGILAYELVAGHRPFNEDTEINQAVVRARDEVEPLTGVPWWYKNMVETCLEFDAEHRYSDMGELVTLFKKQINPQETKGKNSWFSFFSGKTESEKEVAPSSRVEEGKIADNSNDSDKPS
jgi:serine/threonine protein kinase